MVLNVLSSKQPASYRDVLADAGVQVRNAALLQTQNYKLGSAVKHIQVMQGEWAVVQLDKEEREHVAVSSNAATTCCIVVLHCPDTRTTFLAHVDDSSSASDCKATFSAVLQQMHKPHLYMVGGLVERKNQGPALASRIVEVLHTAIDVMIEVRALLCCEAVTDDRGQARSQCLYFDCREQEALCPSDLGPEPMHTVRHGLQWARMLMSANRTPLQCIYTSQEGVLLIKGLQACLDAGTRFWAMHVVRLSDQDVLAKCSTSPEAEADGFAQRVRDALQWVLDNVAGNPLVLEFHDVALSYGSEGWRPRCLESQPC